MNILRKEIMHMTSDELWDMFTEMDIFEDTGVVANEGKLREISEKCFGKSDSLSMMNVGHEVWRELAERGSD